MGELHQHPDGNVFVRTDAGNYADSAGNFATDAGVTLPVLPLGADERIYSQDKRHAFMGGGNIIDGGPMPWPLGDQIIANVAAALAAKSARETPAPRTLEQTKANADQQVEIEFHKRASASIAHTVGGLSYEWHADDEAVQNIMGVVLLIGSGVPVPDPRPWTPKGSWTPVSITHAELIGLGAAIAARKDALFVTKKAKQAEIAELGTVEAVAAFDITLP
jgi:hypothetical protein